MDFEQQFAAIRALSGDAALRMRKPGDWYVTTPHLEIGNGKILSSTGGNGVSPIQAIDACWKRITELKPGEFLVVQAYTGKRREVRWNGFMWEDINREGQ